jgi:hypothetical protein
LVSLAVTSGLIPAAAQARPRSSTGPVARAALALAVTPLPADNLKDDSVVLRTSATVSVLGADVSFQYGTTTAYGASSDKRSTSLIGLAEEIRIKVDDLEPTTTYHYRAVVRTGGLAPSVQYGPDQSLTTVADDGDDDEAATPASGGGTTPDATVPNPIGTPAPVTDPGTAPAASTTPPDPAAPAALAAPNDGADGAGPEKAYDGPAPVKGVSIGADRVKGTVTVVLPDGTTPLTDATALPTGTIVDTTRGTVALTAAVGGGAAPQTGQFWGGVFEVRQSASGVTTLVLRGGDFSACPADTSRVDLASAAARATVRAHMAAAKTRAAATPPRTLWGKDHHGRFQSRGRGSVATVRGTRWKTEDWCQGTVTRVVDGAVAVHDLHLGRDRLVRAGHSYFARVAGSTT